MKKCVPAVLILLLSVNVLFAADLKTYQANYDKQMSAIILEHGATISKLNESYSQALNVLSERATSAGDLDKAKELMAETERFGTESTVTPDHTKGSSPDLKKVQLSYLQNIHNFESAKARKVIALVSKYDSALGKLQMTLTRQKNLNGASAVQTERKSVTASEELVSAKKTLTASKVIKTSTTTQKKHDITATTKTATRSYVEFDGDGCVILGTPSNAMNGGKATYQAWICPSIKGQSGAFIWDGNDRGSLDRVIRFSQGKISVTLNAAPHVSMISKNSIPEQEWSHISVVIGRTSLAIYINGKLDSEKRTSIPSHDDASFISLGRGVFKGALYDTQFFGKMSDVRLWRRSLTDDEILNVFKDRRIKSTGLIGVWDFKNSKYTPSEGKKYDSGTLGDVEFGKE